MLFLRLDWLRGSVSPGSATSNVLHWVLAVLLCVSASVLCAAEVDPQRAVEEGLRREELRLKEIERPESPSTLRPPVEQVRARPPEAEHPCFAINSLVIEGSDAAEFAWLASAARDYRGRCLGTRGLSALVATLNEALVSAGFVTSRVSLPPQNLSGGQVRLHLDTGRVERIRAEGLWPRTWINTVPVRSGDILNARDLEQGVEQATRLPSAQLQTRIEAGEAPDSSVVILDRSAVRPWRIGGTVDNSGSRETGEAMLQVSAAYDNPLGLSDMISVLYSSNLRDPGPRNRAQSTSIDYSIPFGYGLLSASYSRSGFGQMVKGATQSFWSHGVSDTAQIRYAHTFWRSGSARTGAFFGLSSRSSRSYLEDIELEVQRRHTVNAEAGLSWKRLFRQAVLDLSMSFREGVGILGAQDDLPSAQTGGATLRPRVIALDADFSTPVSGWGPHLLWSSRLHGQTTPDVVLSIDQLAIGGRGSVRGFDGDGQLLGERGAFWRNELSWGLTLAAASISPYLALDYGVIAGPSAPRDDGRALSGVAAGIRGRKGAVRCEIMLGQALKHPRSVRTSGPEIYFSLGADI